nr:unnamed protein product [Digitaria exilis]
MQHGTGDYASSGPGGHYYPPHQYPPPGSNPYAAATDAPAPGAGGYASAPPYSVGGGYTDQPPSAPAYSQPPPAQQQPHYGAGYPPYNANPAPYPPEPYYTYTPPPSQPAVPPVPEPNPPPLPYDAPYYGGGYQPPATGYEDEDYLNEGAYAYSGGAGSEPYGARGTAPARSGSALFDDYGRSISVPSGREERPWSGGGGGGEERPWNGGGGGSGGGSFGAIAKALPKADSHEDASGGAQKFRVKLLPEGAGNPTDVLCQIGLDGIRMLDPSTSRTLRIYPLDSLTRWEVLDSTIFAIWAKTSVDIEAKRIRLKSNSYTANTMLDTVTAATVQFKEIGGDARSKESVDAGKSVVQSNEKKKGFDWMFAKPVDEVKDHWVPDEVAKKCHSCAVDFSPFNRRVIYATSLFVYSLSLMGRIALTAEDNAPLVRVCDRCMGEVTQRLSMAKAASRSTAVQSHEDLARKLKEEMERNRKSSGPSSGGGASGTRMREVACPTCTVHLQVQVPTSGSETVECGVCQHAFLVSAN